MCMQLSIITRTYNSCALESWDHETVAGNDTCAEKLIVTAIPNGAGKNTDFATINVAQLFLKMCELEIREEKKAIILTPQ